MHKYKFKIKITDWMLHIAVLMLAIIYSVIISFFNTRPSPSPEQIVLHVVTIMLALFNLFVLYKRKHSFVELDNYSIRFNSFVSSTTINLVDVKEMTRTTGIFPQLNLFTSTGKVSIPLNIEDSEDFLNNLCEKIDRIYFQIDYNRDNILTHNS